jgi:hypothetical protein
MKANIKDLKVVKEIPTHYNGTDGYHKVKTHHEDGWRDVVKPTLEANEKLGSVYFDEVNDVVTYNVVVKSTEEIESETRNAIKSAYQSGHEIEGNETYQEFRVDLIRAMQKAEIDKPKLFQIEDLLEPIYRRVKNGNWDSASNKINQTSVNPDSVIESWRQKAITVIQDYINNNYNN